MMLLTFFRRLHPSTRRADPEDRKTSLLIDVDQCLSGNAEGMRESLVNRAS